MYSHNSHVISLPVCFPTESKLTGDGCVFKFLRRYVDGALNIENNISVYHGKVHLI